MKRILGLVVVFAALFATAAFGEQFGDLSIEVADGWTASQEGSTVAIIKDDNTASLSITLESADGASLEELANAFAQKLGGSAPQLMTEGVFEGDYAFEFTNANGVKCDALISGGDTYYLLIVVAGGDNAQDEIIAMISSISLG